MGDTVAALAKDLTARLADIADECARGADQLATPAGALVGDADDAALVATAQTLLDQRRARSRFLPPELFHEPAWDMLLALFVAQHERRVMNVKTLVGYSEAPVTTSQRWIDHLHKLGLIERIVDMVDRRRIEVQLSGQGDAAMRKLLDSLQTA